MQNWAWALFKLSQEEKQIDVMLEQAIELIALFGSYQELTKILSSMMLSKDEKKLIIDKIFASHIHQNFINFFKLLIDRRKFFEVRAILKIFRDLCNENAKIVYGIIFSTIFLKEEQIKKIETVISEKLQQKVNLINKIDLTLIGGIKVKVNDKIFDGSIKGKLTAIKKQIQDE